MPISFHADPPATLLPKRLTTRRRNPTTDSAVSFGQRIARMGNAIRTVRPRDTVKWTQGDLAAQGVSVGAGTVKGWISESNPQWPSGKHLDALIRAYGAAWFVEHVYPEDPVAPIIRAQTTIDNLEAELTETLRLLERLRDKG